MPLIAIGAALIADVGIAGTVGGIIAGTAALTVTSALEIVGAVGATISAVGAVAHDKGLQTAGMVLGGIGGIGALASSAGLLGSDAEAGAPLFGTGPVDTSAPAGMTGPLGQDAPPPTDVVNSLDPAKSGASAGSDAGAETPQPEDIINQDAVTGTNFGSPAEDAAAQSMLPSGEATTPGLNQATSAATPPSSVSIAGGTPTAPVAPPAAPGVAAPAAPVAPVTVTPENSSVLAAKPGALSGILDFANKNPAVTLGVLQAAGSFISGATSTLTPAQVDALNAQAAQNQAAANLTKQQTANAAQPIPTATRTPQQTGLINTQPVNGMPT